MEKARAVAARHPPRAFVRSSAEPKLWGGVPLACEEDLPRYGFNVFVPPLQATEFKIPNRRQLAQGTSWVCGLWLRLLPHGAQGRREDEAVHTHTHATLQ